METDVAMPDDPPEKDESSKDPEKDTEPVKDYRELPTKEPSELLPDSQCINQDGQDEASAEEAGTDNSQTARKASKKSPCKLQQGAVFSGKILSFCCSECKGDTTYSPNDLLKHFQGSHKGSLPTFPCDLCSFVTNEFSSLQRHRIGHRNPQVTCEICNDGVQYSLLLLTRHYIMCHSQNGHFRCEKCEFSTRDAGTFVQHIHYHNEGRHKCVKCQYASPTRRELQRHVLVHSATFPFTCHFCGYGAARKDYLTKHMATAHCEENDRKCRWKMMEEKPCMTSPPGLKLLLKKGPVAGGSREPQWMSKLHTLPGVGLLDQNGGLYNPEKTLEETQQFLERAVRVKKENSMWMKSAVKTEPQGSYPSSPATPQPKPPEMDSSHGSGLLSPNNSNGLTVLMVKNKISIPPNCTTKVMGFKMVDGKKHLVLKVIPTKQEPSSHSEGETIEKELESADDTPNDPKYPDSSDDGEKSYNSSCSLMSSPLGSLHRLDSMESSTAGATNDLVKPMKGADVHDMDDEVPMEVENVVDAEQSTKSNLRENCLEDVPFLPISQCESTASSTTKESETTVHQSNGEIHSENSVSFADPLKSTIESSHLHKPLDSDENKAPTAHSTLSKATFSDSVTESNTASESEGNTITTSHSFTNTPSDTVIDIHSDSSGDKTMPSHSAENDICPADSCKDSLLDTDLGTDPAQSDAVHYQGTGVEAVDCIAYSHCAGNGLISPNNEAISSDLTVLEGRPSDSTEDMVTISDSGDDKDITAVSIEDKATPSDSIEPREAQSDLFEVSATLPDFTLKAISSDSFDKSPVTESTEENEKFDSVESRTSERIGNECKSSTLLEDSTPLPDTVEVRDAVLNSVEGKDLCEESDVDNDATEDSIEDTSPDSVENKERISYTNQSEGTHPCVAVISTEEKETNSSSLCCHSSEFLMEKAMSSESGEDNEHFNTMDVASTTNLCKKAKNSLSAANTESTMSQAVRSVEEPKDSSVKETNIADLSTKKSTTSQSSLEVLAPKNIDAAETEPSSGSEEPDSGIVSAKDKIVLNCEANNTSLALDTVPLSLICNSTSSGPSSDSFLPPNGVVELATPLKKAFTDKADGSEIFNSEYVYKDSVNPNESQNTDRNSQPISEQQLDGGHSEPPPPCATEPEGESPESSHKASIECFSKDSRTQNSSTSEEQHSGCTRDGTSTHESPSAPKASKLSESAETHTVVIDEDNDMLNSATNSPNQEVFSFHNYSKETSSTMPEPLLSGEQSGGQAQEGEEVDEEDVSDVRLSADWSLTLDASPPHTSHCQESDIDGNKSQSADDGDNCTATLEKVSDSDIEVDECIAAVDEPSDTVEKQPSVQTTPPASNKIEEDAISAGLKGSGIKNDVAVLGRILEKHSDAIINQQLEKERMGSSAVAYDSVRPTKTTLKILQTPEGKQQMFLQTPDNQYAVPVQLKSAPGFKLITKSSASKINVSYVQPGIERSNKTAGLALTLSSGRLGIGGKTSSGGDKGPTHLSSVQLGTSSTGGHYLVNSASLKSPILLSGSVKSPTGEQTTNRTPTCYLLQRPLPVSPVAGRSSLDQTGSNPQTQQSPRPVLAMPVSSTDKTSPLQAGRQAYLVRYISPAKSGILLNNAEGKTANSNLQPNESGKSRVFLKIVRSPNGTRFLSSVPGSLGKKPIYLATGGSLQSPCFLMSSNKSVLNLSAGLKASNLQHGPNHQQATLSHLPGILPEVHEGDLIPHKKSFHLLNQTRVSQRKRRRKALFDDMVEGTSKARRLSSRSEREEPTEWTPVPKDVERTLRLSPFSAFQHIKVPRQNQPVVVLNHPDVDIPEVVSIMKSVNKFKGDVLKVALSQRTVQALSELSLSGVLRPRPNPSKSSAPHGSARARLFGSTVRERFILKLKLKKMSRNRYEVVRKSSPSGSAEQPSSFSCWFCGRIFNNQEDWIGHGQRHLMEATRDWNKLF